MTRRDMCYFIGKRATRFRGRRAEIAWNLLAARVESFGEKDIPKFKDLLRAVRWATIKSNKLFREAEDLDLAQIAQANPERFIAADRCTVCGYPNEECRCA